MAVAGTFVAAVSSPVADAALDGAQGPLGGQRRLRRARLVARGRHLLQLQGRRSPAGCPAPGAPCRLHRRGRRRTSTRTAPSTTGATCTPTWRARRRTRVGCQGTGVYEPRRPAAPDAARAASAPAPRDGRRDLLTRSRRRAAVILGRMAGTPPAVRARRAGARRAGRGAPRARAAGAAAGTKAPSTSRQIVVTALRLLAEERDVGDLKLVTSAVKELRHAFRVFKPFADRRKVSVFGSARTPRERARLAPGAPLRARA